MANEIRPGDLRSPFFRNNPGRLLKYLLYTLPALLLLLVLSTVILPSKLKEDSKNSVVAPVQKDNKGFVGKSNLVLLDLLQVQNHDVKVKSVADLNKRYPAFEFALPYDEAEGSNVSDVRLVGINPDCIRDQDLRNFYYNSSIPALLKKQRANLSEKYFYINFNVKSASSTDQVTITKIYLKPDMFKIALEKELWKGTVMAAPNSLFDDGNHLYLVHKDMVLPLANVVSLGNLSMSAVIYDMKNDAFYDSRGQRFDYYRYYKDAFGKTPKHLRVDVKKSMKGNSVGWIDVACKEEDGKKVLQIIPNKDIVCRVTAPGEDIRKIGSSEYAGSLGETVPYKEGMRVLIYDRGGSKLTEFAVVSKNPMTILSTMSYNDEGIGRYYSDEKNADVLTRQMTRGVCRNMSNVYNVDTVRLSVDPLLSLEFENEMKQYLMTLKSNRSFRPMPKERFEMSITVMDMATGEILASPSVSDRKDEDGIYAMASRNSSLVRRPIGSTFKPLLTLASVLTNPTLLDLKNTSAKSRIVEYPSESNKGKGMFLGRPTTLWVAKHWGNECDMTQYLAKSDDVYPVLLAALCLSGKTDKDNLATLNELPVGGNSYFTRGETDIMLRKDNLRVDDYEITEMLATLYSVHSFNETDMDEDMNLNYYMWEDLFSGKEYMDGFDMHFGLDEVSPDVTNMRYDRFGGHTLRSHLVSWVLGQGDNDWSCIKMAEAWTRMLTKKPVKASFVIDGPDAEPAEDLVDLVATHKKERGSSMTGNDINNAWNKYLDNFRKAQSQQGGTLYDMYNAVSKVSRNVRPSGDGLVVLSKTGTPDEYKRMETKQLAGNNMYYDVAQFVFSLMPESSFKSLKDRDMVKGITCVVRITRSYENKANDDGMWSTHARNFFSEDTERLEKLYHMTKKHF